MYARILVPIDGSDAAAQGLREAIALARELKSTLVLLHVVNEYPLLIDMAAATNAEALRQDLWDFGKELLAQASRDASEAGVPAESLVREMISGRVGDLIAESASQQSCRLIVMGTHGRRGLTRLALGSDAEITLRCAPVPVLMVRRHGIDP
ncbi:universal stress protein [Azohydromonas lata]|uniref:Universal stress protein n=1 Tax=Azohydromonas lata TaxID=45677 RepID=A0ABU5IC04_9BURK|nr:universal stress protein [Azohydromonas lata]MDZ5456126.1 universal stress protein [Azohydromonas lata]